MARTKYYHTDEAAKLLGISTGEVCQRLNSGLMKGYKHGRRWLVNMDQECFESIEIQRPTQPSSISRTPTRSTNPASIVQNTPKGTFVHNAYTRKAMEVVMSGESVFITGKAGTGKTYLLTEMVKECRNRGKNVVVVAPTGVAARNAGGKTIHSFLKLKPLTFIPGVKIRGYRYALDLDSEQLAVIRNLDMLIIDEISMVRCDLFDCVDDQLRHYRGNDQPFGGVQVVLFGDLYQLPPVLDEDKTEAEMIHDHYESEFVFHSDVWKKKNFRMLELETNQRQKEDEAFFEILNRIRVHQESSTDLARLNRNVVKGLMMNSKDNIIKLTSLNKTADRTNFCVLQELPSEEKTKKARIRYYKYGVQTYIEEDEWEDYRIPKDDYPTDKFLKLKVGAKVMFLRNEPGLYDNGTIGFVKSIGEDIIVVRTEGGKTCNVERACWPFYHDYWDKRNKVYEQYLFATFEQFPLRLAWAVTIHKSQGLTFNNVIIDIRNAFAHGQTYVALSRCKSMSGIRLNKDITPSDIIIDENVIRFMNTAVRIPVSINSSQSHTANDGTHITVAQFNNTKMYNVMGYRTRDLMGEWIGSGMSYDEALQELQKRKPAAWNNSMAQFQHKYPSATIYDMMDGGSIKTSTSNQHVSSALYKAKPISRLKISADGKTVEGCDDYISGKVIIPNGIETIKDSAFEDKNKITSVILPSSLLEIGSCAFRGCENLFDIELNEGLESISHDAFTNTGIEKLKIPSTVYSIGFTPCECPVEVDEDNDYFSHDSDGMLYDADEETLLRSPLNIESEDWFLLDSTKKIKAWAFENCEMEEITLPDSLQHIEKSAFTNCQNLERISIPKSVIKIDEGVFSGCTQLKSISLESENLRNIQFSKKIFEGFDCSDCALTVHYSQLNYAKEVLPKFKEYLVYNSTLPLGFNTESVIRGLCPIEGVTLGETLMSATASTVNGVGFWGDNARPSKVNEIMVFYPQGVPDTWQKYNFKFGNSYNDWIKALEAQLFICYVKEGPMRKMYQGRRTFVATVEARPLNGSLKITLTFRCGNTHNEGYDSDSINTLNNIDIQI